MKRTTVAYVDSSRDRTKRYVLIKRGSRYECTCLDFFFKEDRDQPCKHIQKFLQTKVEQPPHGTLLVIGKPASVTLTAPGTQLLKDRTAKAKREVPTPA